jgi:signal transduction histidine kinase
MVALTVTDPGIGIDKKFIQQHLFQKFVQEDTAVARRYGGTGLGMSISKQLVELMEGRIQVFSEKGKGTQIVLSIPFGIGGEADLPARVESPADAVILKGKRILLVEDNEVNRLLANTVLSNYGAVVSEAVNGMEAVEALKSRSYDIVLMDVQTAELRALASHLQDVREEERADMAREIHDELGQQLTGLKMDVAWVEEQLAEEDRPLLRQRVADTLQLLDHTIMTVRKIAAELRPGILDDLGLLAAVEWQSEEFEKRSGIKTRFRAGMPGRRYPSAMSIGLFRICQEALTNVARHSGAKLVEIFLGYEEDQIVLRVMDDGRGLPPPQAGGRKTLGVLGMKERALMMGGTLEVTSEAGKGVTLIVSVPMSAAEKT